MVAIDVFFCPTPLPHPLIQLPNPPSSLLHPPPSLPTLSLISYTPIPLPHPPIPLPHLPPNIKMYIKTCTFIGKLVKRLKN